MQSYCALPMLKAGWGGVKGMLFLRSALKSFVERTAVRPYGEPESHLPAAVRPLRRAVGQRLQHRIDNVVDGRRDTGGPSGADYGPVQGLQFQGAACHDVGVH